MSGLAPFVLGLCAREALIGRTWAADRIAFDPASPVVPTQMFVVLYAGRGYGKVLGRDLLNADAETVLRFEMFAPFGAVGDGVALNGDAARSLVFGCLWRQIESVLLTDETTFAKLWRSLVLRILSRDEARDVIENGKGQKLAVSVVELRLETLADPAVGVAPTGFWADVCSALAAAGGELAELSALLAVQIQATPSALPDWQVAMGLLGATSDEVQMIDLGPADISTPATDLADGAPAQETVSETITPLPDL